MSNDDRVLSQAEIDALLSSSNVSVPAPAAQTPAAAAPKPAAPPPPAAAPAPPPPAPPPQAAAPKPAAPPAAAPAPSPPPVTATAPTAPAAAAPAPAPAPTSSSSAGQGPTVEQVTNLCKQVIAEQTKDLTKQVVELTIKVKKNDDLKQKMEDIEERLDEIVDAVRQSPKAVRAMGARMDEICGLLETLQQDRRQGDEEAIRDQFHCVKCHSEKLVAIHVKCTSCGTENWMGWFPDAVQESSVEHY